MKKVSYLILFITITIFLNACAGYKPIFSSANLNFNINDYSIEGDEIKLKALERVFKGRVEHFLYYLQNLLLGF